MRSWIYVEKGLYIFLLIATAILVMLIVNGCGYSPYKASRQYDKGYEKQRPVWNAKTKLFYPPIVYDSTRTEFVLGESTVTHDTIRSNDTLYINTVTRKRDTIRTTTIRNVVDRAATDAARDTTEMYRHGLEEARVKAAGDIAKSKAETTSAVNNSRSKNKWIIIPCFFLIAGLAIKYIPALKFLSFLKVW